MGKFVVIEGIDAVGKRTLASKLPAIADQRGLKTTVMAFPRYGESVYADLIRDALYGELSGVAESVYGMSLLYALDRRAAADQIRADLDTYDLVISDRYVASNAAYGAARLQPEQESTYIDWLRVLEYERFELPVPDLQILLNVPATETRQRMVTRSQAESDRAVDEWEADILLQTKAADVFERLAAAHWISPWLVIDPMTVSGEVLFDSIFTRSSDV